MFRCFLSCLSLGMLVHAAEPVTLPLELGTLTTVGTGSRTYDGVKIIGRDAVGVKISHEGGTSRIAFEKLPADLRERFSVDPEAAKAQLRAEAEKNAAHDRAVEAGLRAAGETGKKAEPAAPAGQGMTDSGEDDESDEAFIARITTTNRPDSTGKTRTEKIDAMELYIERLVDDLAKVEKSFTRRGETYSRRMARNSHSGQDSLGRMSDRLGELHQKETEALRKIHEKLRAARNELAALEQGN